MLLLLCCLLIPGQVDHLLFVLPGEITAQPHDASREFVVDAATAQFFASTFGPRRPSPAAVAIDRAALRADRTFMQLLLTLVRIEDVILLGACRDAARRVWPPPPEVRLFQYWLHVSTADPDPAVNAV